MPQLFVFLIDVLSVAVFVTGDRCVKKRERERKKRGGGRKKEKKKKKMTDCA